MKILVLGASGMLGNAMLRWLSRNNAFEVFGSIRSDDALQYFAPDLAEHLVTSVDVLSPEGLARVFARVRPDIVINCVGLVKQLETASAPLQAISINALLPHQLARECGGVGARLVHFSTDCVFSGNIGNYIETDVPDAQDLYGRSKLLGEVDYPHAVTLRTSIIGHELNSAHGLVGWFLAQEGRVKGYTHAIFSGLPTFELARVVESYVIPDTTLRGLYHVAAESISKFDLLKLVNRQYGKSLQIDPDDRIRIDRSLDGGRFREATGYIAQPWPELVQKMHEFQ